MRRLGVVLVLSGCAAPFTEVKPQTSTGGVTATLCGTSGARTESVIAAMDGPPLGETGTQMEKPKELVVCVRIENKGARPVLVDRTHFSLRSPRNRYEMIGDKQDDRFVVPPGETKKTSVAFQYGNILSGEDVQIDFDDVLHVADQPLKPAPIVLRRK